MDSTSLLKGKYQIIRELGQGGFGKTFLAESSNRKRCVIKESAPSTYNDKEIAAEMFRKESQQLKTITHPNIPAFIDYFEEDGKQYLVQQYINGSSLAEISQEGQWSEPEILKLLKDLLPVLQYLHKQQIIHRDIKPANIIRQALDGKLFLVDYGAAKQMTETVAARTGTMIGSVGFAAPEQIHGKSSYASDIYSLGMTCAVLLTQTSPFELMDLEVGELSWHSYMENPVSKGLSDILNQMMATGTIKRFQSAEQVLEAIETTEEEDKKLAVEALKLSNERSPLNSTTPATPHQPIGFYRSYLEPSVNLLFVALSTHVFEWMAQITVVQYGFPQFLRPIHWVFGIAASACSLVLTLSVSIAVMRLSAWLIKAVLTSDPPAAKPEQC